MTTNEGAAMLWAAPLHRRVNAARRDAGAGAEVRTRTPLRAADFKSAASASSATPARHSVPAAMPSDPVGVVVSG